MFSPLLAPEGPAASANHACSGSIVSFKSFRCRPLHCRIRLLSVAQPLPLPSIGTVTRCCPPRCISTLQRRPYTAHRRTALGAATGFAVCLLFGIAVRRQTVIRRCCSERRVSLPFQPSLRHSASADLIHCLCSLSVATRCSLAAPSRFPVAPCQVRAIANNSDSPLSTQHNSEQPRMTSTAPEPAPRDKFLATSFFYFPRLFF